METKEQILLQSEQLFMRYGIRSVTMDDISRELGISKKTLYQHVENKSDLIEQIFTLRCQQDEEVMSRIRIEASNAIEELIQIGRYLIGQLRQLSPTTRYDLQKYYGPLHRKLEKMHEEYIYAMIHSNLQKGQEEGLYRENLQSDIIAKLFMLTASSVGEMELFPAREYDLDALARQLFLYHIHGVASRQGLDVLTALIGMQEDL